MKRMSSPAAADTLPRSPGAWPSARGVAALYLMLTAAVLLPFFLVDSVPLADMANHMARIHILASIDGDSTLAGLYRVNWGLQPNLVMDVLLPPLAGFFRVEDLARWFAVLTVVALVTGTIVLHRALHGRIGLWPAASLLFVYNHALIWGLLNYLFGIGLALWMLAGWIASADRPGWRRGAAFAVACLGLYFVHLMALGIYGGLLGMWELARAAGAVERRRLPLVWLQGAAQFVPAAALYLATLPPAAGASEFDWGTAGLRLRGIWSPTLTDIGTVDAAVGLFVVAVLLAGLLRGWFRLAPGTGLPLAVLFVGALVAPTWLFGRLGGVFGVDMRLWVALAFFAVAAARYAGPASLGPVLATAALLVLGARVYQIQDHWRIYDAQIREYRAAALAIAPGSRVLQVQERSLPIAGAPGYFRGLYFHLSSFSVIDRDAFVPLLFTDPAKQPLAVAPALSEIDTPVGAPMSPGGLRAWADPAVFDWFKGDIEIGDQRIYGYMWQDRFDYAVVIRHGEEENPVPEALVPLVSGSFFTIYRIRPGTCIHTYPQTCAALRANGRNWALQ